MWIVRTVWHYVPVSTAIMQKLELSCTKNKISDTHCFLSLQVVCVIRNVLGWNRRVQPPLQVVRVIRNVRTRLKPSRAAAASSRACNAQRTRLKPSRAAAASSHACNLQRTPLKLVTCSCFFQNTPDALLIPCLLSLGSRNYWQLNVSVSLFWIDSAHYQCFCP